MWISMANVMNDNIVSTEVSTCLMDTEENIKAKYIAIVQALDLNELLVFNKSEYKKKVQQDMNLLLPDFDKKQIETTAHYVSNALNNEAQIQRGLKRRQSRRTASHTDSVLGESPNDEMQSPVQQGDSEFCDMSDWSTFVSDDTLNSTVTLSQMDSTYQADDSVTLLKSVDSVENVQENTNFSNTNRGRKSRAKPKSLKKTKSKSTNSKKAEIKSTSKGISCVNQCSVKSDVMTRCNMCMTWFHDQCVGLDEDYNVGWWCCEDCRKMPEKIMQMCTLFKTFQQHTNDMSKQISDQISELSSNTNNKLQQLDDRITALANQNKCHNETFATAQSDMQQSLSVIKSDLDKKTNIIMTKSQGILDKIRAVPDSATSKFQGKSVSAQSKPISQCNKKNSSNIPINNSKKGPITSSPKKKQEQKLTQPTSRPVRTRETSESSSRAELPVTIATDSESPRTTRADKNTSWREKPKLTLLTGSNILKGIETTLLRNRVRVKTFKEIKIDQLGAKLKAMNFEPYEKIILQVGGYDVSSGVDISTFKTKLNALLLDLKAKCKIAVSGLLPRDGFDMKPYNVEIKSLCQKYEMEFIDNHDSFLLASGEFPKNLFHADKINLRAAGTATLVKNIDANCKILRKHDLASESKGVSRQRPQTNAYKTSSNKRPFYGRDSWGGSRYRPIHV